MGDYDPDFGEEMGSLGYTPQGGLTSKGLFDKYSKDLALKTGGFEEDGGQFFANPEKDLPNVSDRSDDDLRMDEDKVESINPMYEDFKKSQETLLTKG